MTEIPYTTIAQKLQGQRVILVGGAGFIGHNLAIELRRLGADVAVIDNMMVNQLIDNMYHDRGDLVKRKLNIHFINDRVEMMRSANVFLKSVDARNLVDLTRVFDEYKPTKVVHMSAIASAVEARKDPGLAFDLQLVTLRNVVELCRIGRERINQLMFMSSSTVYGDFETPIVDETTRPNPRGIYANTKYMGERLLRDYGQQYGIGVTVIRPSALYGERCVSRRVSQAFIENALAGRPLLLEGGGDGRLDFTYIEDLVEGMVRALALHYGPEESNTFNLTFGNARNIAEIAAIVKELVPGAILEDRPRALEKPIRGTLSMQRALDVLGFVPKWPIETGYRKYCQWYIDQWNQVVGKNG
jgi:nucleoside-diphosphate-sugar epimerase